jgi:Transposase DDE domain
VRPIIALNAGNRLRKADPKNPYRLPSCDCGLWVHHGSDYKRRRGQYRCPSGKHGSQWLKPSALQTLIPRDSRKWRRLYRGRNAVERVNGRLKEFYGLTPVRTRGLERVQLHVDLTMLALLAAALARSRAAAPTA